MEGGFPLRGGATLVQDRAGRKRGRDPSHARGRTEDRYLDPAGARGVAPLPPPKPTSTRTSPLSLTQVSEP